MEIWREVPGYGGWYECGDHGSVRSWKTQGRPGVRSDSPHSLKPGRTRGDYLSVNLCLDGAVKPFRLNRLVLLTFKGEPFRGAQACHRNGDRSDNRLDNLYWGTSAENQADKERHGTQLRGESVPSARLTREAVAEVRALWASGDHTVLELAERYGVSGPTLWKAATGKTWKVVSSG